MKKTTYVTTRFDVRDGFYVEVTPSCVGSEKTFDFVLCKQGYGTKIFMFGLLEKNCPPDMWETMIENNVDIYMEAFDDDIAAVLWDKTEAVND